MLKLILLFFLFDPQKFEIGRDKQIRQRHMTEYVLHVVNKQIKYIVVYQNLPLNKLIFRHAYQKSFINSVNSTAFFQP